ncbi:MAG: NAD(+) diphosphatase [Gammaproteobacteria bacterium]|nr:NAD(+) diphosphatase [Gammaproteobacteria bacterium]
MFANFDYLAIDREAHLRVDTEKIGLYLKDPNSRIVLWHDKKLIHAQDDVFFKYAEIAQWINSSSPIIYLGHHQNLRFFSVNLESLPDQLKNHARSGLRTVGQSITGFRLGLVFHAQGLLNWHRRHIYCSYCGYPLAIIHAGHAKTCQNSSCGKVHYPKLDPAVIFSIEHKLERERKLLLGRQPHWQPRRYSVIAGFVEPGESLEDAVRREAFEETGLVIEQVDYVDSQPWPFPDALMVGFHAQTRQDDIQLRDQELEQASWYSANQLEQEILGGHLEMPLSLSISWHLIDRWFSSIKGYSLADISSGQ